MCLDRMTYHSTQQCSSILVTHGNIWYN